MGRVLRAYDPKLQREVALKEIRREVLDAAAIQRLVGEARAMAKLSHPNVVAVYDVEILPPTHVVLVMEYVAGVTLKQWLAQRPRSWREVVQHFCAAGRGLGAAHQAGLLHRDFKPANVLVADVDAEHPETSRADRRIVKVTDFGIAKLFGAPASSESHASKDSSSDDLTAVGTIVGTPRYMSPEQHGGQELTASADQYAFCLALWEALGGESPFGANSTVEAKRAGPPPWRGGDTPRSIANAVIRGLAPRPEDRWPSMADLLNALERAPGRRRARVRSTVGAIAVSGIGIFAYQAWSQARAQQCSGAERTIAEVWNNQRRAEVQSAFAAVARPYADQAFLRAAEVIDGYARDWTTMHTEACEATTVRGEQSPHMMDLRMACLHRAALELRSTVDVLAGADAKVIQQTHELTAGLRPLAGCGDTDALAADVAPPDSAEADSVDAARVRLAEAQARSQAGRYQAAREALQQARAVLEGVEYGPILGELALAEGNVLERLGEYAAAETALTEAVRLTSSSRQWTSMRDALKILLVVVGARELRPQDALRLLPLLEGLCDGDVEAQALLRADVAMVLRAQGKHADAEREDRAALALLEAVPGADRGEIARLHNNLATALLNQGKPARAAVEYRAALAAWADTLGSDHPHIALVAANLASTLVAEGKFAEGEAEHRRALAALEAALGPDHPSVAQQLGNLGIALAAQQKFADAEAQHRKALAIQQAIVGRDRPETAKWRDAIGADLAAQDKFAEAEVEYRAALATREASLGPDHPHTAWSRRGLANVLAAQGNHAAAEVQLRAAVAVMDASPMRDHPDTTMAHTDLARLLMELDRAADALPIIERAWDRQQRDDEFQPVHRAYTTFVLARTRWELARSHNDRSEARRLAEDALEGLRALGQATRGDVLDVEAWLAAHPRRR